MKLFLLIWNFSTTVWIQNSLCLFGGKTRRVKYYYNRLKNVNLQPYLDKHIFIATALKIQETNRKPKSHHWTCVLCNDCMYPSSWYPRSAGSSFPVRSQAQAINPNPTKLKHMNLAQTSDISWSKVLLMLQGFETSSIFYCMFMVHLLQRFWMLWECKQIIVI